jgi:hypothetical protein
MARIMCTQKLLRALQRRSPRAVEAHDRLVSGTVLGNWAATLSRLNRRDLVIALNERTYLTLVFPLMPREAFRSNFASALGQVLDDHGVERETAVRECAEVEVARLASLADPALATALDNAEFICSLEAACDNDLGSVQARLNDFPHPNRDPCAASEAVILLFAALAASRRRSEAAGRVRH